MKKVGLLCSLVLLSAVDGVRATVARQVLKESGVTGGFVVHVGCGDGELAAELSAAADYIVQGLETDPANVSKARKKFQQLGLGGRVTAERFDGTSLPYIDNMVNLIVAGADCQVPPEEILRVLAPNGVALVETSTGWKKTVKPRPEGIDDWTHHRHDATGNAVAQDTVIGPPKHLQWVGSPRWARHHDHTSSMDAMVSNDGRIFYVFDEGSPLSIQMPAAWTLMARDAFNGTILWKKPLENWVPHLWPVKSGPTQISRRLVAVGDRVYVTLALDAPLSALDARTGAVVHTYADTKNTEEVICSDGTLFAVVNDKPSIWPEYRQNFLYMKGTMGDVRERWPVDEESRTIAAMDAESGKMLWKTESSYVHMTLAADGKKVVYYDGKNLICRDCKSGNLLWTSPEIMRSPQINVAFGPTLVIQDGVVLLSGAGGEPAGKAGKTRMSGNTLTSFSAIDGKILWTEERPRFSFIFSHDLPVIDGMAWIGAVGGSDDSGIFKGYDICTGEVQAEFGPDITSHWFHHRCYPPKATLNYILTSRNGVEFVDLKNQSWEQHHWMRGSCIYGIMPANGMIYLPQNACACYIESKLTGLCAVAPERAVRRPVVAKERLEKGPAYHDSSDWKPSGTATGDWPVYRHDPARSGTGATAVPVDFRRLWKTTLNPSLAESRLSQPVVADGRVFIALEDDHAVYALDEATGAIQWSYVAGGRIDSAPAFYRGRIIFGSNDGFVYCLRAADGALAWRFRAAPEELRQMAFEQIESVWPVSGSVLLLNDTVYCMAGRNMFLDGGMRLVRLDPLTGKTLSETVLDQCDPSTGENLQGKIEGMVMPAAQPDILSSDGTAIYLRSQRFNLDGVREEIGVIDVADQSGQDAHLFGNAGFLDDSWFYRTFWEYGRSVSGGYGTWPQSAQYVPYGRILVFNDSSVFGFGRKPEYMRNMSFSQNQLFSCVKTVTDEQIQAGRKKFSKDQLINDRAAPASNWAKREPAEPGEITAVTYHWSSGNPPLLARALVLAGDTLFAAGPPRVVDEQEHFFSPDDAALQDAMKEQVEACRGKRGALLWAVSAVDGKKLAEYPLDSPPSFDGMSAANQRLYVSCLDGTVVCFGRVSE